MSGLMRLYLEAGRAHAHLSGLVAGLEMEQDFKLSNHMLPCLKCRHNKHVCVNAKWHNTDKMELFQGECAHCHLTSEPSTSRAKAVGNWNEMIKLYPK